MLPQIRALKNEGVVLLIVLIVIMVMAVVSLTLFSQSMSQSKTSRAEIDQLVAEQLAKGAFWAAFNTTVLGGSPNPLPRSSYVLNNRTFTASVLSSSGNITTNILY